MNGRIRVVLGMVAVVKEQGVVEAAVMAGRAPGVLEIALQGAQAQTGEVTRKVRIKEELRSPRGYRHPERQQQRHLKKEFAGKPDAGPDARMMRQVTIAPQHLRDSEQHAQIGAEQDVRRQAP